MVICLQRDADLHMAQLMPLPLTVSCFSKIQIGVTFLVPAHPGSPGKRAVKRVCARARVWVVGTCMSVFRAGSAAEKLSLNDLRMLFGLDHQSYSAFQPAGFDRT